VRRYANPVRLNRIILASASPRRRDLLSRLGIALEVRPVDIDESPGHNRDPQVLARRLAREKAEAARLRDESAALIAADTVVWLDGETLGKPADAEEARSMLDRLRGREHQVVTAVAFMPAGKRSALIRHPVTHVEMRDYTAAEIDSYVASGAGFDKAGGYGIQDRPFSPVSRYRGCYCNVIGVSLFATMELLRKGGVKVGPALLQPQCRNCPLAVGFAGETFSYRASD
jgi:MAF protein